MDQFRQKFFWGRMTQITDFIDQRDESSEDESDEDCRNIFRQIHNNALHGRLQGKFDQIAAGAVQKMDQTLERNMNATASSYNTTVSTMHASQFAVEEPSLQHATRSTRTSTPRGKPNALRPVNGSIHNQHNGSGHSSTHSHHRMSNAAASNFSL